MNQVIEKCNKLVKLSYKLVRAKIFYNGYEMGSYMSLQPRNYKPKVVSCQTNISRVELFEFF